MKSESEIKKEEKKAKVVVIGGGIAGVSSALKLAKLGVCVMILERDTLFSGSSGRNPGRMGHGFHYFDLDTAITYLEASISVQREYPDFLVGSELDFNAPVRHGRYYITKDSNYPYTDILDIYRKIQLHYAKLVEIDPRNMVFGHPDSFIRELEPAEYAHMVDMDRVVGAVETNEHLFCWPKFANYLREIIAKNPNIKLIEHAEVVDIIPRPSLDARFAVKVSHASAVELHMTDFIINSSWENIEYLNDKAGIGYCPEFRTNRLKCLLEVELPEDMHSWNSAFFCMGSFCMFSNMGDGRGMITLADQTNMAVSSQLKIDESMQLVLSGKITDLEREKIEKTILEGASQYLPKLRGAKVIGLKFGIVQTLGHLDLATLKTSKEAPHHLRNYDGIREEQQGLISNPAVKLFYFVSNAKKVEQIYLRQKRREDAIRSGISNLFFTLSSFLTVDLKKTLMMCIDFLTVNQTISIADHFLNLSQLFNQKLAVLDQMKSYFPPLSPTIPSGKDDVSLGGPLTERRFFPSPLSRVDNFMPTLDPSLV